MRLKHVSKHWTTFGVQGCKSGHYLKAVVFPVVMYGCEIWAIKKAEHKWIDTFELWYWRRLLRVPWTARQSNQSILKKSVLNIHLKDWCWSWSSSTLATWCKELTLLKKTLMLGKIEGRRRRGWQRMRWLNSITNSMDVSLSNHLVIGNGQGSLVCCDTWGCKGSDTTEGLNWT